jgi:glucose/arabinose dehydrogenase
MAMTERLEARPPRDGSPLALRAVLGAGLPSLCLALCLALCLLLGSGGRTAEAAPPQMPGVQFVEAWPDVEFSKPVDVGHAPDGSDWMYVAERGGRMQRIQKWRGVGEVPSPSVFLDLRSKVYDKSQGGLLSFAFHPEFRSNQLFYVCYVTENPTPGPRGLAFKLVIAEYRSNGAKADPASERVVMEVLKHNASHGAGCIRFSPTDRMLYISVGDGNVPNADKLPKHPSQNAASYMGKILRIDPMGRQPGKGYAIPAGNPWPTAQGVRPEIWSYGYRNPWRFDWDDKGRLWTTEPGSSGPESREWVQEIVYSGNARWPFFEGMLAKGPGAPRGKVVPATFEYVRGTGGSTAGVGGVFYRGDRIKGLKGKYVFGDFMRGEVYALDIVDGPGGSTGGRGFAKLGDVPDVGGFGVDAQGEIYAASTGDLGIVFTLTTDP